MAYPSVIATNTSEESSNTTTHTVSLPSGIVSGSLVFIFFASDGDHSWANLQGWTLLRVANNGTACGLSVIYKFCTGSEGGSVTLTTNENEQSAHISWRISGDAGSGTPPDVSTGATGSDDSPDPDNCNPADGTKDYLVIAVEGNDDDDNVTAYPLPDNNTTKDSISANNSCNVGVCSDELNVSQYNPDVFTLASGEQWSACTVMVHPGVASQTLIPGGIASGEAFADTNQLNLRLLMSAIDDGNLFGTLKVNREIYPSSIGSGEAFADTNKINLRISPSGIVSEEAFVDINQLNLRLIMSGIDDGNLFGDLSVANRQILIPGGIGSEEAFPDIHQLNLRLYLSGISSEELFGSSQLNLRLLMNGISSGELFGSQKVNLRILPGGIASLEGVGSHSVGSGISVSGIASLEAFGSHQLNLRLILPGIASLEGIGSHEIIQSGGDQTLLPSAIGSLEVFGSHQINFRILPGGIGSGELFGSTVLANAQILIPGGIGSLEGFGSPQLNFRLYPSSIGSGELFGSPQLNLRIIIPGIGSGEIIGDLSVLPSQFILPGSIGSGELFGSHEVILWNQFIIPGGIGSEEVFGSPVVLDISTFFPIVRNAGGRVLLIKSTGTLTIDADDRDLTKSSKER